MIAACIISGTILEDGRNFLVIKQRGRQIIFEIITNLDKRFFI